MQGQCRAMQATFWGAFCRSWKTGAISRTTFKWLGLVQGDVIMTNWSKELCDSNPSDPYSDWGEVLSLRVLVIDNLDLPEYQGLANLPTWSWNGSVMHTYRTWRLSLQWIHFCLKQKCTQIFIIASGQGLFCWCYWLHLQLGFLQSVKQVVGAKSDQQGRQLTQMHLLLLSARMDGRKKLMAQLQYLPSAAPLAFFMLKRA